MRSDWSSAFVSLWLRSQGVAEDSVHRLRLSGVDGQALYNLYFDGYADSMEAWFETGVFTGEQDLPKVREVLQACRDLEHFSWMLPSWVRAGTGLSPSCLCCIYPFDAAIVGTCCVRVCPRLPLCVAPICTSSSRCRLLLCW